MGQGTVRMDGVGTAPHGTARRRDELASGMRRRRPEVIRPIVKEGDPVLRQRARPVKKFNRALKELVEDMFETMYHAPGVGLAANQIGIARRLAVIDVGEGRVVLVNPEIRERSGRQVGMEGCLSIPGLVSEVERAQSVLVYAWDADGREQWLRAEGFYARAMQHEIDHLDGVLNRDRALRVVTAEEAEAEAEPEAAQPTGPEGS
jgi:peptide deformylase